MTWKHPNHWAKKMTACRRGHPYTPENTYRFVFKNVYGQKVRRRRCRVCDRENARKRRAKGRIVVKDGKVVEWRGVIVPGAGTRYSASDPVIVLGLKRKISKATAHDSY